MLNAQTVAAITCARLGDADNSRAAKIILRIPEALKRTARKIAANPVLRNLLVTDKTETELTISGGAADLAEGYADFQFLLEYLDCGEIYHADSDYPLQKAQPVQKNLVRELDGEFIYYYVEGNKLFVLGEHTGKLQFAVPYFPLTLEDLPDSEEVETLFLDKLYELIVGNDAAEDGEK